jgi:hypothetical protein
VPVQDDPAAVESHALLLEQDALREHAGGAAALADAAPRVHDPVPRQARRAGAHDGPDGARGERSLEERRQLPVGRHSSARDALDEPLDRRGEPHVGEAPNWSS